MKMYGLTFVVRVVLSAQVQRVEESMRYAIAQNWELSKENGEVIADGYVLYSSEEKRREHLQRYRIQLAVHGSPVPASYRRPRDELPYVMSISEDLYEKLIEKGGILDRYH